MSAVARLVAARGVDVTGSDKVIQNLYFSGNNAYTLSTSEARKLIFDSATVGGLTHRLDDIDLARMQRIATQLLRHGKPRRLKV